MLMVQSKPQAPPKNGKLKPPPPVPPRPNQNVVAEALAKTRRAVADSRLTKTRPATKDEPKSKTLERQRPAAQAPANVSPKLNGLARVKSFIRDVISDRSSSDDKKSTGASSRRSSTENSSIPAPITPKNTPEQKGGKTIKSCRQALVRSLSTSTKLEQESKKCALKPSSSFVEKTLPLRRAPPPPLSPKPKLREVKPVSLPKRNSLEIIQKPKAAPPMERPPPTPPKSPPPSPPVNVPPLPVSPIPEAPYATVDEVIEFDNRLSSSPELRDITPAECNGVADHKQSKSPSPKFTNSLERKTSRVTERLISEIIASKNKPLDSNTVIDKGKCQQNGHPNGDIRNPEGEQMMKDMNNHEMLIYELQTMRSQTHIPEQECQDVAAAAADDNDKCSSNCSSRAPSIDLSETSEFSEPADPYTCGEDDPLKSRLRRQFRAISSMSLQGLPPLPKSLGGFAEGPLGAEESPPSTPTDGLPGPTDMDSQLALLKREMASLRRLDLSLLSELWSLNEAMAAWRQQLERAPRLRPAPPPPPPHYLRT